MGAETYARAGLRHPFASAQVCFMQKVCLKQSLVDTLRAQCNKETQNVWQVSFRLSGAHVQNNN